MLIGGWRRCIDIVWGLVKFFSQKHSPPPERLSHKVHIDFCSLPHLWPAGYMCAHQPAFSSHHSVLYQVRGLPSKASIVHTLGRGDGHAVQLTLLLWPEYLSEKQGSIIESLSTQMSLSSKVQHFLGTERKRGSMLRRNHTSVANWIVFSRENWEFKVSFLSTDLGHVTLKCSSVDGLREGSSPLCTLQLGRW